MKISVIAPVFNEEEILPEFYNRVTAALAAYDYELVLLDDGSKDKTWSIIESLAQKDKRIKGIKFSRNFGHQAAITAGFEQAIGDAVVAIDADLQDPPEVIPQLIQKWQEGYDIVAAQRSERKGETAFKRATAHIFYRLIKRMSSVELPEDVGDFRLMSRRAVDSLNHLPEKIRFMRGLSCWVGYRQTTVSYSRDARSKGQSKYPFFKMLRFAVDGITSFTPFPLQFSIYLGIFTMAIAFLFGLYSLILHLFTEQTVKGWTSLLLTMIFLGGVQLLMIGIVGEYLARIYDEVKSRPVYLIEKKI